MGKNFTFLCSGGGEIMEYVAVFTQQHCPGSRVTSVICTAPGIGASARADRRNLFVTNLFLRDYPTREAYEHQLLKCVQAHNTDYLLLVGYKRVLTPGFVAQMPNRIVNLHPGLLPAFQGFNPQQQAIDYGVRFAGCTVHFVDAGVDTGPIITQGVVVVTQDDTEQTLCDRLRPVEIQTYTEAVYFLHNDLVTVEGRKVLVSMKGA